MRCHLSVHLQGVVAERGLQPGGGAVGVRVWGACLASTPHPLPARRPGPPCLSSWILWRGIFIKQTLVSSASAHFEN